MPQRCLVILILGASEPFSLFTAFPKFFPFRFLAQENGNTRSEKGVSPSVSKSPQKSQLTKLLGKVKKEQQLKGIRKVPASI